MVIDCAIARSGKYKQMNIKLFVCNFPPWSAVDDLFSQMGETTHWGKFVWFFHFFYVDFRDFGKSEGTLYFPDIPTLTQIKPRIMVSKKLYAMINLIVLCRCNKKCGLPTSFLRQEHTLVYLTTMYIPPYNKLYPCNLHHLCLSCIVKFK